MQKLVTLALFIYVYLRLMHDLFYCILCALAVDFVLINNVIGQRKIPDTLQCLLCDTSCNSRAHNDIKLKGFCDTEVHNSNNFSALISSIDTTLHVT